jgi:uncharacterized protein (DUF427 family)
MPIETRRIPGPDHPITVEHNPSRVVVRVSGRAVADSVNALTLREASYPPVDYIPRKDVDMSMLEPSEHRTYCPFKGKASYFSIPAMGGKGENAVWSYEDPYEAVSSIRGYLAFYPDRVDAIEELPAPEAGQF